MLFLKRKGGEKDKVMRVSMFSGGVSNETMNRERDRREREKTERERKRERERE